MHGTSTSLTKAPPSPLSSSNPIYPRIYTLDSYIYTPGVSSLITSIRQQLPGPRDPNERIQARIAEMAQRPSLLTNNLTPVSEDEGLSSIASPARGRETANALRNRLRPPPFVHAWDWWYEAASDSKDNKTANSDSTPTTSDEVQTPSAAVTSPDGVQYAPTSDSYNPDLKHLHSTADVKSFWEFMNHFSVSSHVKYKASLHLFHKTVLPVWEHPRNVKGGAWFFRVPKDHAEEFWKQICLAAVGEQLQEAVKSDRVTFKDDICGVSFSWRWGCALVQVWNRDADHKEGVERILETVKEVVDEGILPKDYYYKKHSEHSGFKGSKE